MNLDAGPLVERLGLRFCVCSVNNIIERILHAIDNIEALCQPLTCLGICDELILHAACKIKCCIARNILIHKDINLVAVILGIDARRVAHIGSATGHHLVVPVVCVAVCLVVVYAEVLLISCPAFILYLESNIHHILWEGVLNHRLRQVFIAESLILALQDGAGSVFEVLSALSLRDSIRISFLGMSVLQAAIDGAIAVPT